MDIIQAYVYNCRVSLVCLQPGEVQAGAPGPSFYSVSSNSIVYSPEPRAEVVLRGILK